MHTISETVCNFLKKYNLSDTNTVFLVGFSGGYDSLCLLDVLYKMNLHIAALHLNHNWRGDESQKDCDFCKTFCEKRNIPFYTETLPEETPHTETAAREARYRFFEEAACKFKSKVIFTAHNANDNAETVLYRVIKGTGVEGLCAIAENRGIFYRPLLSVSRVDIENYCRINNLIPNIDSSNSDITYKRNFIRHKLLPVMEEINKDAVMAINSLSEIAREETDIVNLFMKKIEKECGNSTKNFIMLSPPVRSKLIYNLFKKNNLDYDRTKIQNTVNFILENADSKSGKTLSITNGLNMFVNAIEFKFVNLKDKSKTEIIINHEGSFDFDNYLFKIQKADSLPENFPEDEECKAFISTAKIDFTLRYRQDGDIIQPLGMNGVQKLKKYFNAKKIPNHKKDFIPLLCKNKEVLWVSGFGISEKLKVGKNPVYVLELTNKQGDDHGN